jgi:hypothetical protein
MPFLKPHLAICAAVLVFSWPVSLTGASWWPWEPLRVCLVLTAVLALSAWRGRAAVVALVCWALVASPLVVRDTSGGFTSRPPGRVLATGVPSGPFAVSAGDIAVAATWFAADDRAYLNGESDYADSDLVAWSFTWVPWPHVDRSEIIGLGGNVIDFWFDDEVQVRRDGDDLLVSGDRHDPESSSERPEVRAIGLDRTESDLTVFGWFLVLMAAGARAARAARRSTRQPLPDADQ